MTSAESDPVLRYGVFENVLVPKLVLLERAEVTRVRDTNTLQRILMIIKVLDY